MSETIFTNVDSDLRALIEFICWSVSSPPCPAYLNQSADKKEPGPLENMGLTVEPTRWHALNTRANRLTAAQV